MDVKRNVDDYLDDRAATSRPASWDYCFNFFQKRRDAGEIDRLASDAEAAMSCLHLGFYLASWGMMRASAKLHARSLAYLRPVIARVAAAPAEIWEIDADDYLNGGAEAVVAFGQELRRAFADGASDILVTKTMLGVFGNVPAFDRNFKRGFGPVSLRHRTLTRIGEFYEANRDTIDKSRPHTLDFVAGTETDRWYTRAKVIDMAFWWEGR